MAVTPDGGAQHTPDYRAKRPLGMVPTLADCCLLPQVFNARRLSCDLSGMPVIARIAAQCEAVDAFQRAMPGVQGDAE